LPVDHESTGFTSGGGNDGTRAERSSADRVVSCEPRSVAPLAIFARGSTHFGEEELGVVFDARNACGITGYSATVFLTNMFTLPGSFQEFLKLPRETFDTVEELSDRGWRVD